MQNQLTALEHKAVSIALQKSIVLWLITMLGIEYPSNTTANLVRQMVAAIVKRDNIKKRSDLSGKRHISRGAVFAKATPAIEPPPAEQAEADEASGGNGANAEQAPTPPPTEVEAGPAEKAAQRPAARAASGRRR